MTSSKLDIKRNEAADSSEYLLSLVGAKLVCRSVLPSSHPNWKQKFLWIDTEHLVTSSQAQSDIGHPPKVALKGCV